MDNYFALTFGPDEITHQHSHNSAERYATATSRAGPDGLSSREIDYLTERDSFYLASVGANGWPYIQHRGGPAGFVKVVDAQTITWAERSGNRQYITAGHLDGDDRVSMIAVDYPTRRRLKLLGHARYQVDPAPEHLEHLDIDGPLDALITMRVVAFDWNCPKFITPRYTAEQVRALTTPLQQRIAELEALLSDTQTRASVPQTVRSDLLHLRTLERPIEPPR